MDKRSFMTLIPEELNPYEILNVKPNSSFQDCKSAFRKLITKPSRYTRIRASLAYDILYNKQKYKKNGNLYRVKKRPFLLCCCRRFRNSKEISI